MESKRCFFLVAHMLELNKGRFVPLGQLFINNKIPSIHLRHFCFLTRADRLCSHEREGAWQNKCQYDVSWAVHGFSDFMSYASDPLGRPLCPDALSPFEFSGGLKFGPDKYVCRFMITANFETICLFFFVLVDQKFRG